MDRGLHGPLAELPVEFAGFGSQGIPGLFDVGGAGAVPILEGFQVMFGLPEQLAPLVAARVAGDFASLVDHPDVRRRGPHDHRLPRQVGRGGVAIAVELDAGQGSDDGGHDLVRVERQSGQGTQQRTFLLEAIHGAFPGRLMEPHVGHFLAPADGELGVILPAGQLFAPALQGIPLDVPHAGLDHPFRFRVPACAGDRFQTEVAAEGQKLRMQAGRTAVTVKHGRLEVVENDFAGTPTEELQGVDEGPIEVGLALRQRELDVNQSAIAQDGHQHGDPP